MKKIFILVVFIVNIYGWEINTHRAVDQVAIGKSTNLKKFINSSKFQEPFYENAIHYDGYGMTYIQYIDHGEKNGISQWGQKFDFKPEDKKATVQDLIEAGAILEDAQWPHGWVKEHIGWWDQADGRFNNHFADPQKGYYKGLGLGESALLWAWGSSLGRNEYIWTDAKDRQWLS